MNRTFGHKIGLVSVFCIAITALAFHMPMTCQGQDFTLTVEFSPNIINIESIREGSIRIQTGMPLRLWQYRKRTPNQSYDQRFCSFLPSCQIFKGI